jgi:hypothetical protein
VGASLRREVTLGQPAWTYSQAMRVADGALAQPFDIHVAQISDLFGAGPFVRITVND